MQDMIRDMAANDEKREKDLAEKFEKRWRDEEVRKQKWMEQAMNHGKGMGWNVGVGKGKGPVENAWHEQQWSKGGWQDEAWKGGVNTPWRGNAAPMNLNPAPTNLNDANPWGIGEWPQEVEPQLSGEDQNLKDWEEYKNGLGNKGAGATKGRTLNAGAAAKTRKKDADLPDIPEGKGTGTKPLTKKQQSEIKRLEKQKAKGKGKSKSDQKPSKGTNDGGQAVGPTNSNDESTRRPKRLLPHPTFDGLTDNDPLEESSGRDQDGEDPNQLNDDLLGMLDGGITPNRQERKESQKVNDTPVHDGLESFHQGSNLVNYSRSYDDQFDSCSWARASVAGSWGRSSWGGDQYQYGWGGDQSQGNFVNTQYYNGENQPYNGAPNYEANQETNPG